MGSQVLSRLQQTREQIKNNTDQPQKKTTVK